MMSPSVLRVRMSKPVTAEVVGGPRTPSTEKLREVPAAMSLAKRPSKSTLRMSESVPGVSKQLSEVLALATGMFEKALHSTSPGEVDVATYDWI